MLLLNLCDLFSMHKKAKGPFLVSVLAKEWGGLGLVALRRGLRDAKKYGFKGGGGGGAVRRKILGLSGGH